MPEKLTKVDVGVKGQTGKTFLRQSDVDSDTRMKFKRLGNTSWRCLKDRTSRSQNNLLMILKAFGFSWTKQRTMYQGIFSGNDVEPQERIVLLA